MTCPIFDFSKKEQKSDGYIKLNPNGQIPTIVDRGNDDFGIKPLPKLKMHLVSKCEASSPQQ